jgi:hypothetical protein
MVRDGDEDCGSACSGHGEGDEHSSRLKKFNQEDTSAGGSENNSNLLKPQEDEEDARTAEEADVLSGIPLVGYTAEGHGYNAGDEGSHGKNTSDIAHFMNTVHQRDSRAGAFVGEYEEVDGGAGGANARNGGGVDCLAKYV